MKSFAQLTKPAPLRLTPRGSGSFGSAQDCAAILLETVPRIMRAVRVTMAATQPPQLTVPQFRTLLFVQRCEGASLSAAADNLGLTLSSTSKLVDQLVKRGLLQRQSDPVDRRRMTLRITASGEALVQGAQDAVRLHLTDILKRFQDPELAVLQKALGFLQESFAPIAHNGSTPRLRPAVQKVEERV